MRSKPSTTAVVAPSPSASRASAFWTWAAAAGGIATCVPRWWVRRALSLVSGALHPQIATDCSTTCPAPEPAMAAAVVLQDSICRDGASTAAGVSIRPIAMHASCMIRCAAVAGWQGCTAQAVARQVAALTQHHSVHASWIHGTSKPVSVPKARTTALSSPTRATAAPQHCLSHAPSASTPHLHKYVPSTKRISAPPANASATSLHPSQAWT